MPHFVLALLVTLLAPSAALACGMCVDAHWRAAAWWAGVIPVLALLLLLELVIFAVAARLARLEVRFRRRWLVVAALAFATLAAIGLGGSGAAFSLGMVVILLPAFFASVLKELPGKPALRAARLLAVVVPLAVLGVWPSLPSEQSSADLVKLVLAPPHSREASLEEPRGFAEAELMARAHPEALVVLEEEMRRIDDDDRGRVDRRGRQALRLHQALGGPAPVRAEHCRRWKILGDGDATAGLRAVCEG